jgi:hypothetical protein
MAYLQNILSDPLQQDMITNISLIQFKNLFTSKSHKCYCFKYSVTKVCSNFYSLQINEF